MIIHGPATFENLKASLKVPRWYPMVNTSRSPIPIPETRRGSYFGGITSKGCKFPPRPRRQLTTGAPRKSRSYFFSFSPISSRVGSIRHFIERLRRREQMATCGCSEDSSSDSAKFCRQVRKRFQASGFHDPRVAANQNGWRIQRGQISDRLPGLFRNYRYTHFEDIQACRDRGAAGP